MRSIVILAALLSGLLFSAQPSQAGAFTLSPDGTFNPIPFGIASNGYGIGANAQYYGINDSGQITGQYLYQISGSRFGINGFIYSDGVYSTIPGPDASGTSQAYGINNAGKVLVNTGSGQSYIYNHGQFTQLNIPFESQVFGISNSGDIVGVNYADSNNRYAFLYQDGVLTTLPIAPGATGFPRVSGVNNAGQIVGSDSLHGAFVFSSGVFTSIRFPGAISTGVQAINDSGEIVGSYTDAQNIHGFSYRDGVYTTIDYKPEVGQGTLALSVSDNGEILGTTYAYIPQTPEPSSAWLIAFGFSCVGVIARRQLRLSK